MRSRDARFLPRWIRLRLAFTEVLHGWSVADLPLHGGARPAHAGLPPPLQADEEVPRPLGVFKRLTQFIQSAKAEIEVCDHLGVAVARVATAATWARGVRESNIEQHQSRAEDDGYNLVVHATEGVKLFVDVKQSRNSH